MDLAEQIIAWCAGFCLFAAAFYFIKHSKLAEAFLLIIGGCVLIVLGFSSVQALVKTGILREVVSSLKSYGDKLNAFEMDVTKVRNDLGDQQRQIISQQVMISAQQQTNIDQMHSVAAMQARLDQGQAKMTIQQEKLEHVEYWVDNLFNNMRLERFSLRDTNKVWCIDLKNDGLAMLIKMRAAPIQGSVHLQVGGQTMTILNSFNKNIIIQNLWGFDRNSEVVIDYVLDPRETNLFKKIEVRDGKFFANDSLVRFDYSDVLTNTPANP